MLHWMNNGDNWYHGIADTHEVPDDENLIDCCQLNIPSGIHLDGDLDVELKIISFN